MAGPITAKYRLMTKTFGAYHDQIKRLLLRPKARALESDDASLIGTYNWEGLLKPARDDLAAHIARKDNPHQESIESMGSYSPATITSKMNAKIPNGIVPVSHYGVYDELTDAQIDAGWTASGWVLSCSLTIQCALSGTLYRLPPQQLSLLSVDSSPANKTFNVYVRLEFGLIRYQARADSPPESATVMYIGQCTTNDSGIVSKRFMKVNRIDTFRLSNSPIGSAIPVGAGTYDAPVKLSSAWRP